MDGIVWTPEFYGSFDFKVHLDKGFAQRMLESTASRENQRNLVNPLRPEFESKGVERLFRPDPYIFHEESGLVLQMSINGNGVWLAMQDSQGFVAGSERKEILCYNSHNVDCMRESYALMLLFQNWVNYSNYLIES
jgi:hypothetical protein